MPRQSKGARLWLQPARRNSNGEIIEQRVWVIRDGSVKRSTGCSEGARGEAEKRLGAYIAAKHAPQRKSNRDPDQILIADVLSVYAEDVAPNHARPEETAARLGRLLDHFGTARLSKVNGKTCRAYAQNRGSDQAARRELEDLRAAINHYWREGFCSVPVAVTLPPRSLSRGRWLTRSEAAKLLRAARRMRQSFQGTSTKRATGAHLARFILVALYTGTRASLICGAAIRPTVGHGYVDLENGLFYRKPHKSKCTKKRAPPIPLPDRLLAHLRRWEHKRISRNFVVEWNGRPIRRVKRSFLTARTLAGLGKEVTPHILRHTAATWLMQRGVDIWEAAGYLGMSAETLERDYGHHHPNHLQRARTMIARQKPDSYSRTEREHSFSNAAKISDQSREVR